MRQGDTAQGFDWKSAEPAPTLALMDRQPTVKTSATVAAAKAKTPDCTQRVRPVCSVCRTIRVYLIFAIPLIFMAFAGVRIDWPDINMTAMVGNIFLGAFCLLVAWRIYVDYFRKK
jgi:hypothetical protein